jgi:hypothetical protein
MAETSRLESLPPEIFNRILSFVFDPSSSKTEESETHFSGYRFDVSLLCVNKAVYQLARSYLHHALVWVKVNINLPSLPLVDPHWLGVRYLTIPHTGNPKRKEDIRYPPRRLSTRWRHTSQDVPEGRMRVKVKFPQAITTIQAELIESCMTKFEYVSSMSVLVLGNDFPDFMRIVRMADLAYSHRTLPGTTIYEVSATPGIHGMQYEIDVNADKKYESLLECFRDMHGTLHKCIITGANDNISRSIVQSIEHPVGSTAKRPIVWEAICHALWCKHRGDEHLREGMHYLSYATYASGQVYEDCCTENMEDELFADYMYNLTDPQLTVPGALNAIISHVYVMGVGLPPDAEFSTKLYNLVEDIFTSGTRILMLDRITIVFILGLYACLSEPATTEWEEIDMIIDTWERDCKDLDPSRHPTLGFLSQIYLATVQYQHQITGGDQDLPAMRNMYLNKIQEILRSNPQIPPFKWGILEEDLHVELSGLVNFLPKVDDGLSPRSIPGRLYMWGIPGTCSPHKSKAGHVRILV